MCFKKGYLQSIGERGQWDPESVTRVPITSVSLSLPSIRPRVFYNGRKWVVKPLTTNKLDYHCLWLQFRDYIMV